MLYIYHSFNIIKNVREIIFKYSIVKEKIEDSKVDVFTFLMSTDLMHPVLACEIDSITLDKLLEFLNKYKEISKLNNDKG